MFAPAPPPAAAQGLPAPPMLTLEPGCGAEAIEGIQVDTQTFRLRNFTPDSEVTIVWGQEPPQTVVVGPYGALDRELTFTRSGTLIQAFETNDPSRQATTTFRVRCEPFIRITPSCDAPVDPAAPRPLAITVQGDQWDPFAPVRVWLYTRVGDIEQPVSGTKQVTSDEASRSFSVVLDELAAGRTFGGPLTALPAGQYFVTAVQDRSGKRVDAEFIVPCAQILLNPSCGEAGSPFDIYDILITGAGFQPNEPVQFIFDTFGQQQVFDFNVDLPFSGELTFPDGAEVRIEPYRRPGPDITYFVTARQGPWNHIIREASTTFVVPCPPEPTLTINPLCGPPQLVGDDPRTYDLAVTGQNLAPGVLSIVFDPEGVGGLPAERFDIAVNGSLTTTINPKRRPIGAYQVVVTQEPPAAPLPLTVTFLVPCQPAKTPALTVRCDPPDSDQPELAEVVVEGRGFFEDGPIELSLGTASPELARTDVAGRFTRRLPAANLPDGPFEARATQRDANGVVAEAQSAIVLPCGTREPLIQIVPSSRSPGLVVQVRGFSFRANSTIRLRWSRGIGSSQPITITVASDGTFTRQVLIFYHDFVGAREMTAESDTGPIQLVAPARLVVVPGRGSPPVFADSPFPGSDTLIMRR